MKRALMFLVIFILSFSAANTHAQAYVCGDIDDDPQQKTNIQDITLLVRYLFESGATIPIPIERANVDCSAEPNPNILDLNYLVNYCFNGGSVPCAFTPQNAFSVQIEKTHNTVQGEHEYVDVTLQTGIGPIGSFDFLIAYDSPALTIADVHPDSAFLTGCGWEYFTYGNSSFGSCGNACASSKVRITGIADINNGTYHPSCFFPYTLPARLFTLDFLVSSDLAYECQFMPVRFVWFDCQDNTITNRLGDVLFLSRNVYDFDNAMNLADSAVPYPTFRGANSCASMSPATLRFIDFNNGGVDIECEQPIDIKGDVNANELPYEIADAVLFSAYFEYGLSVFDIDQQRQIAATDVNADGLTLGVADLVYLCGVVMGRFTPAADSSQTPPSMAAIYTITDGQITIDNTVAAAFVVVEGEVTPTLLAVNVDMGYHFDGTNTNILIIKAFSPEPGFSTFNGPFVSVSGNVLSAEFGTALGGVVNATRVDGK